MSSKKDIRGGSKTGRILLFVLIGLAVLLAALVLAFYLAGFRRMTVKYLSAADGSEQEISFTGFVDRDGSVKTGKLFYETGSATVEKGEGGICRLTYSNGDIYEGTMDGLQRQGQGKITFKSGGSYEGAFENDRFHGTGRYVYVNGDVYEGQFRGGKKSGVGRYTWAAVDGKSAVFEGQFENDLRVGFGVYTEPGGAYYKGGYQNDLRNDENAEAVIVTSNGGLDRYFGAYKNDKRSGFGVYFYANGDVYVGMFENNNLNGKGTIYSVDGDSYTGVFEQGNIKTENATMIADDEAAAKIAELKGQYGA